MKAHLQFDISIYEDKIGLVSHHYVENPTIWFPHVFELWNKYSVLPRIGDSLRPNDSMKPINHFEKWLIENENEDIVINSGIKIEGISWNCDYKTSKPIIHFWLRLEHHDNYYEDYEI
jgi:hypothetical protein